MRRSPPPHVAAAAVSMLMTLLLCGCTILASDPTIRPGLDVGRAAPERDLQVAPPGPRRDATPEQIVRDFIQALAGSGGDFVSAREFLSGDAVETWSPDARTVIFRRTVQVAPVEPMPDAADPDADDADAAGSGNEATAEDSTAAGTPPGPEQGAQVDNGPDPSVRPHPLPPLNDGDRVLRLSAAAWAGVDRTGRFRELPQDTTITSDIVLTQQEGQWRIRHLEPGFGRWIGTTDFDRVFDTYAVHYVYRADRLLVPDVRYIPTDRVATRLAQLQLGPVPDYLSLAVRDDIPLGARLAVGAVPIVGGVATVDLTGGSFGADPEARRRVWAQFVATLAQVRGVDRVQITLDGNPLEIPGVESVRSLGDLEFPQTAASLPTTPPLVRQGVFMREFSTRPRTTETGGEPVPPRSASLPAIDERWHDLALSFTGGELAGVSGDALSRWRNRFRYEVPRFATDLGRPCYDSQDVLWIGGTGQLVRERLFYVNAAASPVDPLRSQATPVAASWLTGRRVLTCQVSPQGTRIAVISADGEGGPSRLDIGTILRESNGLPTAVIGPQPIAEQFAVVRDTVWLGETSLALLGQTRANAAILDRERAEPAAADEATGANEQNGSEQAPPEGTGEGPAPVPSGEPDVPEAGPAEADPAEDGLPDDLLPDPLAVERGVLPYLITVGGRTTPLPSILGGQRITTTGGERNLVITTSDTTVYVRVGSQWLPAEHQGRDVVVATR